MQERHEGQQQPGAFVDSFLRRQGSSRPEGPPCLSADELRAFLAALLEAERGDPAFNSVYRSGESAACPYMLEFWRRRTGREPRTGRAAPKYPCL